MNAPGPGSTLRPLGVGEILDRAVNLCVKHFVALTMIFLVYAIPLSIVQYYATKDFANVFQTLVATIGSKDGGSAELTKQLNATPGLNGWYPVLILMTLLVYPLPAAALIVAAASFYLGRPTSFGAAYRSALPRWPHLLGLNFMYGLVGGFLYFVVAIISVMLILGIGFVYEISHAAGIAIGIIIGTVVVLVGIAFLIVVVLAYEMSFLGCVLERQNLAVAFTSGLRRVFVGIGLQRSLLVGVAFVAIYVAIGIVSGTGEAVLIGFVHSTIAATAYTTIVRVVTAAFSTAFVAIFYFDLRVREEGLDLQLAAQASQAGPQLSSS